MDLSHISKLASKFAARGFVFKAAKKAAVRGGKVGIGAFSLLVGGYLAYSLLQKREERKQKDNRISNKEQIVV